MNKIVHGLDDYSYDEIINIINDFIIDRIYDTGHSADDIHLTDIQLHGSRIRGDNKKYSDLDAVVEYDGDIREDDFFNILNSDPLYIDDIKVDINPIKEGIDMYMKRSRVYDRERSKAESLKRRVKILEDLFYDEYKCCEDDDKEGVIRKVGNKWKILKKNRKDYWDAEYKTKADAEAALRAYWANKRECLYHRKRSSLKIESFSDENGQGLIRSLRAYLSKIFGPTLYFNNITDTTAELFYRGRFIAELLYNKKTDEITIMPDNPDLAPVQFGDTEDYMMKDYLSDLIMGDVE
jgi:predicted nucleotidyltransferase